MLPSLWSNLWQQRHTLKIQTVPEREREGMICLSSALSVPTQPSLHSPLWLQLKEGTSLEHTDRETDGVTVQSGTKQIKVWSHSAASYSFSLSSMWLKGQDEAAGQKVRDEWDEIIMSTARLFHRVLHRVILESGSADMEIYSSCCTLLHNEIILWHFVNTGTQLYS